MRLDYTEKIMKSRKKKTIHIGVPMHSGTLSAGTMQSVVSALTSTGYQVGYSCMGLSLLARNFNHLLLEAWNRQADYFVLLHSDIAVAGRQGLSSHSWVDYLAQLSERTKVAAVSVASPIKNMRGRLSMGLDLEKGNHYTLRRMTVRELDTMPKSFITRANVCDLFGVDKATAGAMIINTGVLLMDLKNPCWRGWPGFGIDDEIAWSKSGKPAAFTSSEDWRLSRWMFDNNIPYLATRALAIEHAGEYSFTNHGGWGDAEDLSTPECTPDQWRASE